MALLKFQNKGIRAMCSSVPKNKVPTTNFIDIYGEDHINKFIKATGIKERRIVNDDKCSSDFCYRAACDIFDKTDIKREDIDVLIFVSQTPDYKSPATSVSLQSRLGLKQDTMAFDVNMACSGFIHGLVLGYSLLEQYDINNILLLVGDTLSKLISIKDYASGILLGDAGTATVLSKGDKYGESYFSLRTEGSHIKDTYIPAGAARMKSTEDTIKMQKYSDGSERSLEQIVMNGDDIFSFAIREMPKDIKRVLDFSSKTVEDIDIFAFHQSNNFMANYIAKKSKADNSKIIHSIEKYGNTAGTSIPLCICENRDSFISKNRTVLMNAIGSGYAYGTAVLQFVNCDILGISEI